MRRSSSSGLTSSLPIFSSELLAMEFSKPLRPHTRSNSPFIPPPLLFQPPPKYPPSSPLPSCRPIATFSALLLLLLCLLFYAFFFSGETQFATRFEKAKNKGYAIIIDAGSSGSRAHVFQFVNEGSLPLVNLMGREDWSFKIKPGLSAYVDYPARAGESLVSLVGLAKKKVPEKEWAKTRVYLMATAGLRRLDLATQEAILESCRAVLRDSSLLFQDEWASVITGIDEGVYGWVAANYALGTLGRIPQDTIGIIELGGASAQVTFVPELPPPPEFAQTLELGGVVYVLYTHSFLHFGQEAAWDALFQQLLSGATRPSFTSVDEGVAVNPCTPKGSVRSLHDIARKSTFLLDTSLTEVSSILSSGNFSDCRRASLQLLQKDQDECLYERCPIGSTFVPELRGKFFATENFFYTSQFFGLVPKASLADVQAAGQHFCEEDWTKLQQMYKGIEKDELLKYCFSSAYIVALLHDSLGIAMHDERVVFTNQVGRISLDWALGALIVKMEQYGLSQASHWVSKEDHKTMISLILVVLVVSFIFLVLLWRRRPHTKVIYDLEKGRYTTTIVRTIK